VRLTGTAIRHTPEASVALSVRAARRVPALAVGRMDRHRPRRRLRPDGRRRRAGATVHEPEPLVAAAFAALRSRGAGADSRPGVKVGVVDTLCGVVALVWRRRSTITHDGILAILLVWFAYLTAMALIGQLWRLDAGMPAFVCLWPLSDRTGAA